MKSTYHQYLTREDAQKLTSAGRPAKQSTSYTKDDYLTPGQVATKFDISIDEAKNIMKQLKFRNASFVLNGHKALAIVNLGKKGGMYLHPMGTEIFEQQLAKQRG